MNPTQGMIGNAELSGIIGHDHCVVHQSIMAQRAPQGSLAELAHQDAIEDVQA